MILLAALILAHSFYPWECCGTDDCHPVPCESIDTILGGKTQDGLDYHGDQIKPSPDEQCHACWHAFGERREPKCLFIPEATT